MHACVRRVFSSPGSIATLRAGGALPSSTAVDADLMRVRWSIAGLCKFSFHHSSFATAIAKTVPQGLAGS